MTAVLEEVRQPEAPEDVTPGGDVLLDLLDPERLRPHGRDGRSRLLPQHDATVLTQALMLLLLRKLPLGGPLHLG